MFSAYDLKKIIPRAILALVLVNLSWGLMEIFIGAVESIGSIADKLVVAGFPAGTGVQLGNTGSLAFGAIIIAAGGAALVGIIPVIGVAVSALFGILFAFGIILLRRVLLIGLIIIAPIAIALSVFPQTENYAKKWWDWFSKLMLMYPFIVAMFGVSEVAAGIVSKTQGAGIEKLIYQLAGVVILIIPYFLIGKTLSLAGGTIGKVAGMVNNRDKGLIDRTKKWEAGKVAERRLDAKGGARYQDRFGTRNLNRGLRRVMNPGSMKPWASGSERRAVLGEGFDASVKGIEETRPGIKDLSGEEAEILARARGSKSGARDAIARKASDARKAKLDEMDNPANTEYIGMTRDQKNAEADRAAADATQKWQDTLASADRKAGGIDAVSSAAALTKAAQSGGIDSAEIERISHTIGQAVGGPGNSGVETGRKLAASARKAAAEGNHLVTSHGGEGRNQVEAVQEALKVATVQQLGTQSKGSGQQMATSIGQVIQTEQAALAGHVTAMNAAKTTGDTVALNAATTAARGSLATIVQHRAHAETVRVAAAAAGNAELQSAIGEALTQSQAALTRAEADAAAGGLIPSTPGAAPGTVIEDQARAASRARTGGTLQP